MEFRPPIHESARNMFNPSLPNQGEINLEDALTKAVYFGGIAAFSGKIFRHINPSLPAVYAITRGATDFITGTLFFQAIVVDKEKRDSMTTPMRAGYIFLEIALTGVIACGIFRGIQEGITLLNAGTNRLIKKQICSNPTPFTFTQMVTIEASLVAVSILRPYITDRSIAP